MMHSGSSAILMDVGTSSSGGVGLAGAMHGVGSYADGASASSAQQPHPSVVEMGKQLLECSRDGDHLEVQRLLSKGAPFTTDWLGTSPLHLAAKFGHSEVVRSLLKTGASKDVGTKVGKTALHVAATHGQIDVMNVLLACKVKVDAVDMIDMTPLHWAVQEKHVGAVELLLRHGADPNAESKLLKTPLEIASDSNRPDIFQLLQQAEQFLQHETISAESAAAVKSLGMGSEDETFDTGPWGADAPKDLLMSPNAAVAGVGGDDSEDNDGSNSRAVKFLESHGISYLPEDSGSGALENTMRNGQLTLTEAGKRALSAASSSSVVSSVRTVTPAVTSSGTGVGVGVRISTPIKATKIIKLEPGTTLAKAATGATKATIVTTTAAAAAASAAGKKTVMQPKYVKITAAQLKSLQAGHATTLGGVKAAGSNFKLISTGITKDGRPARILRLPAGAAKVITTAAAGGTVTARPTIVVPSSTATPTIKLASPIVRTSVSSAGAESRVTLVAPAGSASSATSSAPSSALQKQLADAQKERDEATKRAQEFEEMLRKQKEEAEKLKQQLASLAGGGAAVAAAAAAP